MERLVILGEINIFWMSGLERIILRRKRWEPSTVRRWLEEEVMRKMEEQRSDEVRRSKAKMSYKLKDGGFEEEKCGSEIPHNITLAKIMKHSSQIIA